VEARGRVVVRGSRHSNPTLRHGCAILVANFRTPSAVQTFPCIDLMP
jgi:hypothetical protein